VLHRMSVSTLGQGSARRPEFSETFRRGWNNTARISAKAVKRNECGPQLSSTKKY
jgi:hypothetical protein